MPPVIPPQTQCSLRVNRSQLDLVWPWAGQPAWNFVSPFFGRCLPRWYTGCKGHRKTHGGLVRFLGRVVGGYSFWGLWMWLWWWKSHPILHGGLSEIHSKLFGLYPLRIGLTGLYSPKNDINLGWCVPLKKWMRNLSASFTTWSLVCPQTHPWNKAVTVKDVNALCTSSAVLSWERAWRRGSAAGWTRSCWICIGLPRFLWVLCGMLSPEERDWWRSLWWCIGLVGWLGGGIFAWLWLLLRVLDERVRWGLLVSAVNILHAYGIGMLVQQPKAKATVGARCISVRWLAFPWCLL